MGCDRAQLKKIVSLMLSSQTKDEVTDAAVSKLREVVGGSLSVDAMLVAKTLLDLLPIGTPPGSLVVSVILRISLSFPPGSLACLPPQSAYLTSQTPCFVVHPNALLPPL
jgi:hypothetical protein